MENEIVITEMQLPLNYVGNPNPDTDYVTAYMDALLDFYLNEKEQFHKDRSRKLLLKKIKVEEQKAYNKQVSLFIAS